MGVCLLLGNSIVLPRCLSTLWGALCEARTARYAVLIERHRWFLFSTEVSLTKSQNVPLREHPVLRLSEAINSWASSQTRQLSLEEFHGVLPTAVANASSTRAALEATGALCVFMELSQCDPKKNNWLFPLVLWHQTVLNWHVYAGFIDFFFFNVFFSKKDCTIVEC